MILEAVASRPQTRLVNSNAPFPAFVGGFGSGKTHALILRAMSLIFGDSGNIAYYLPTYDLVRTIGYPRFQETLDNMGVQYTLNKAEHTIHVNDKTIYFRTLDNPDRIVGYEVSDSFVDELDTLPVDKARRAWEQIIARNRQSKIGINTVAVGTTPEGYRFVYEQWGKDPTESYELITAPTDSNSKYLPEDYIDRLRETYPSQRLKAYLDGEFVNLTSGSVYPDFNRELNGSDTEIREGEALHIGMDFNVNNGSAVVHVLRGGYSFAVDELTGVRDTPAMIQSIQQRYPLHSIIVYPDASGGATKSVNASVSDIRLLKDAGFTVDAPRKNPFVKDRLMALNKMICNPSGDRMYLVNVEKCPTLAVSLEQQVYDKNGEPDKSAGLDHIVDATGYFIHKRFPIRMKKPDRTNQRWT